LSTLSPLRFWNLFTPSDMAYCATNFISQRIIDAASEAQKTPMPQALLHMVADTRGASARV
jgi:hypothetical protein